MEAKNNNILKQIQILEEYKKIMSSYKLIKLSEGKGVIDVEIGEIPTKRSKILNNESEWVRLETPEDSNVTACIFYGKKGTKFSSHRHKGRTEKAIILNTTGKCRCIIEDGTDRIMVYEDMVKIGEGLAHYVEFLEDTTVMVLWNPAFDNNVWEAGFNTLEKGEKKLKSYKNTIKWDKK